MYILTDNLNKIGLEKGDSQDKTRNKQYSEKDIYEPAKNFLLGEQECTHAVVLGGAIFGKKWGTPDILGAIRVSSDAIYKPIMEIIAVEVKNPDYSPLEALGQAMAYKLFAHRTWLVLPEDAEDINVDRIERIAITDNIGLISFTGDKENFNFRIKHRPFPGHPDPGSVNEMLEKLKKDNKKEYHELCKNE